MSQWVQSKYSKDAKKWELQYCRHNERSDRLTWVTTEPLYEGSVNTVEVPRSEYIPCDPPERWETCTREVVEIATVRQRELFNRYLRRGFAYAIPDGYRWAWSEKDPDALVIQKKVQS